VGTGFDAATLRELRRRLEPLAVDSPPFADPPRGAEARGAHWVKPRLVAEVQFTEWTDDGRLRHPSFQGLREDKSPGEVRRERPAISPPPAARAAARPAADGESTVAGVRLSNPGRVLYPGQGLTKLALARYYEAVAERILPHVAGRPLTLVRCPQGHEKQCFYQKHAQEGLPEAIRSLDIREEGGKREPYVYIEDLDGLIALVQMGVLELHTWGARIDDVERPDRLVFDLDPDPGLPWDRLSDAALLLRRRLAELGLESWVKTTGGKGLHVVVPLQRRQGWDDVKSFARALAEALAREQPDRYLSKASKAARRGKIFIDWLRNARGATAVAAYSTRARDGAPVSAPLRWEEVATANPGDWTVETMPRRLARQRRDPWQGFWTARQSLSRAARRAMDLE
jgi:bifunctional non-homologous end joining protein LigD